MKVSLNKVRINRTRERKALFNFIIFPIVVSFLITQRNFGCLESR